MVLNKTLYRAVNSSDISDLLSIAIQLWIRSGHGDLLRFIRLMVPLPLTIQSWHIFRYNHQEEEVWGGNIPKPPERAQLQKKIVYHFLMTLCSLSIPFYAWPFITLQTFWLTFIPHLFEKEFIMTFYVFFKLFIKFYSNLHLHLTCQSSRVFIIFHFPPFDVASDIWKLSSYFKYLPLTWYWITKIDCSGHRADFAVILKVCVNEMIQLLWALAFCQWVAFMSTADIYSFSCSCRYFFSKMSHFYIGVLFFFF